MTWNYASLSKAAPQAWRNGGGTTRELLAWPTAADWRVRISVADVAAAGPFSRFEGVERWFAVLEGAGVVLRVGASERRLDTGSEPFRFDGGASVDCRLVRGATRDFNLMAFPGEARLQRVRGETRFRTTGPMLLAAYSHHAPALVVLDGRVTDIPAGLLAWRVHERPCAGSIAGTDALWVEATP